MKIYYIRHGQTDWNLMRKMQGGQTDNPLNKTGINQAKETKEKLKDINFDVVICSPMTRARQTAKIITDGKNTPIIVDERLRERKLGQAEGNPVTPEFEKKIWDYNLNMNLEGGEDLHEFNERIQEFIKDLKERYSEYESVLIVAHGGIAKILKAYLYGMPESNQLDEIEMKNCEIIEAEI